jgi:nucleoside-diphosphate-sugar epimerase/predicted dehydrogenase
MNQLTDKKWLILGGGAVVTEYYLPALNLLNILDKIVIVDTSPNIIKTIAKVSPNIQCQQADFREYLNNISANEFEAVIIALPNWLHEEATIKALNCGLHVLCEKPLALTADVCLKLAEKGEAANRILAVGMVRRLLPSVCALKSALNQRLIGEIINVDVEDGGDYAWLSDSGAFFRQENGGVLADMGVHYLDLIEYLLGKLTPIEYQDDYAGGVEANAQFSLQTASGISVNLSLSRTRNLRNSLIIKGDRGELILRKNTFDACFFSADNSQLNAQLQTTQPLTIKDWSLTFESCFAEQFLRFAANIQNKSEQNYVSAREAASTIGLIEWAYKHRVTILSQTAKIVGDYERPKLAPVAVMITGGTGFIGTNLVERLHELEFKNIKVPVRNYRTCANVARFSVSLPLLDLLDYEQVKTSITGMRYVFHLAYGRDGTDSAAITIQGTQNVVEAAIAAGVETVVILSTMYVFGHPQTTSKVDETFPYNPYGGEYGETKAKMEQWCFQRAKTSKNTRIVILNPSCVYGPEGKTYTRMPIEMAKQHNFSWIEDGKGIVNYIFVNNLVDAMLLAATCPDAHGQRFIINDGATTWRNFLTPMLGTWVEELPSYTKHQLLDFERQVTRLSLIDAGKVIVREPKVMDTIRQTSFFQNVKQLISKFSPKLLQKAQALKTSQVLTTRNIATINPITPPSWLADLFGDTSTVFSSEKAKLVLGWQSQINLEKGQELTKAWLKFINLI